MKRQGQVGWVVCEQRRWLVTEGTGVRGTSESGTWAVAVSVCVCWAVMGCGVPCTALRCTALPVRACLVPRAPATRRRRRRRGQEESWSLQRRGLASGGRFGKAGRARAATLTHTHTYITHT